MVKDYTVMETQNILEYLNLFSKKYHQINIALKNCENSLKEYIREKESNLAFEDFIIKLDKENLCFNHSEINYPFIETS